MSGFPKMGTAVPKMSGQGGCFCGRRGLPKEWVEQMYADYQRLGSLAKAGELHGRTRQSMFHIFQNHGKKMNPKKFLPVIKYKGRKYTMQKTCGRHRYLRDTVAGRGKGNVIAYLHHVIWIEHNGPIPPGHKIIFKDGNHLNWKISNLEMLTNSQQVSRTATGHNQFTRSAAKRLGMLLDASSAGKAMLPIQRRAMENPEFVERMLELRREKNQGTKLPPPRRDGMITEMTFKPGDGIIIITGWMEITPKLATHWLDYNVYNRKQSKHKIVAFARQIRNGDFVCTHQGVAFNDQDELIDGQHSLKAVILTGIAIQRMVTFGLPKTPPGKNFNTIDVIDAGGRSVADQLKISHGITESGPKKQICIGLAGLCHGARARNLNVGETLAVLKEFEKSIEYIIANRQKQHGLRQAGVLAGFAFAHAALGAPIEKLFDELNTGKGLMPDAEYKKRHEAGKDARPIEHLRQFLIGDQSLFLSKSLNRCMADVTLQVLYAELHKARTTELENVPIGAKWFANKQKPRVEKLAAMFRSVEKNES